MPIRSPKQFSCNKRVVAEGLEALDLRLKFGTPSGSQEVFHSALERIVEGYAGAVG